MAKRLRIAAIYFPTSAVGGIATSAATFQRAARAVGDELLILKCPNGKNCASAIYAEPKVIRGGDTSIQIDGQVSHHPTRVLEASRWLEANFDALLFLTPCPHPIKSYGKEPFWAELYRECALPKIVRFSDAHYETYPWFDQVLPYVKKVFCVQPAYAHTIKHIPHEVLPLVFLPPTFLPPPRMSKRIVLWTAQMKTVKGYPHFVKQLPLIDTPLALFSSGVYYYTLRTTEGWITGMGQDRFHDPARYLPEGRTLTGPRSHVYYGYRSRDTVLRAVARAWGAISMQGYGLGRREAYAMGSYNNSEIEYIWLGCRPILHESVLRSAFPKNLFLPAKSFEELPRLCREVEPLSLRELKQAREWVLATHDARVMYGRVRQAITD